VVKNAKNARRTGEFENKCSDIRKKTTGRDMCPTRGGEIIPWEENKIEIYLQEGTGNK